MKTTETGKLKRCDKVRVNGRIGTVTGVHEPKWIDHRTRANMHVLQGAMIAFEDKPYPPTYVHCDKIEQC